MAIGTGAAGVSENANTRRGGGDSANLHPRRRGGHSSKGKGSTMPNVNALPQADFRKRYGPLSVGKEKQ